MNQNSKNRFLRLFTALFAVSIGISCSGSGSGSDAADHALPSIPSGLSVGTVSDVSVTLSWSASHDANSGIGYYVIYRDDNEIGTSTDLTFTDDGLTPSSSYSYNVSAVNGAGRESRVSASIFVMTLPVNQAPQVHAGADETLTLPNTLELAASVSDDGLPDPPAKLTLDWSQVSGPGTASFADPTTVSGAVSFDIAGTYVLRLSVTDNELTSNDDVRVIVVPPTQNSPPELDYIGNQRLAEGDTLTVIATASDANNDELSFSASNLPGFATLTDRGDGSAALTLAPGFDDSGDYSVTLSVTDDAPDPLSSSVSFEIEVAPAAPTQLSFTDITSVAGVAGPSHFGGHGAQFADVNSDGLAEIYVTMNFQPTDMAELFYENQGDGRFVEKAALHGIDNFDTGSHGAVWADFDNDGDFDLFNGSYDQNRLYRNNGNGFFDDITAAAGLPVQSLPTRGTIALDMDSDGDLDLFTVTNYQGSDDPLGEQNEVYRNDGNFTFTAITGGALQSAPAGQGAVAIDYDNDGDQDIIAGNRTGPVNVLRNDGNNTFTLVNPVEIGLTQPAGDGITFADANNDGILDLLLDQHFFLGTGEGRFTLVASFETGTNHYMGGFADLDNDGDWDLVFPGRDYVYLNDGTGSYTQSSTFSIGQIRDPRAVAFADIDLDGDTDFFYAQKRTFNRLIRNDLESSNRWLRVKLVRSNGQAGAFGARITVFESGGMNDSDRRISWQESTGPTGYLAQNDPVIHFGVGPRQTVDIKVEFPGGATRERSGVATNSLLQIQE